MQLAHLALFASALALAGCASPSSPQTDADWLLLSSPTTLEYPTGEVETPLDRWKRVGDYSSLIDCNESLPEAQNQLQLPVTCVANDDPRIKANYEASSSR